MNNSRSHTAMVSAIVKRLSALPEVRAIKLHVGRYGIRGTPDVLVVAQGRALLLEVKTGTGAPTPSQEAQMALWKLSGAAVSVVRSVEDAMSAVSESCDERRRA